MYTYILKRPQKLANSVDERRGKTYPETYESINFDSSAVSETFVCGTVEIVAEFSAFSLVFVFFSLDKTGRSRHIQYIVDIERNAMYT